MPNAYYDATLAASTSRVHGKAAGVVKMSADWSRLLLKIAGQISAIKGHFAEGPRIIGVPKVGEVLTAVAAAIGAPSPTKTYQWKRDGSNIAGATNATYTLAAGDIGTLTTVTVTSTNAGGNTAATSPAIGLVVA